MDTVSFKYLDENILLSIMSVVGFLNFGYSGQEFVITKSKLGVYLPVSI